MAVDRPSSPELPATLPPAEEEGAPGFASGDAAAGRKSRFRKAHIAALGLPLLVAGVALAAWGLGAFQTGRSGAGLVPQSATAPGGLPPVEVAAAQTSALDVMEIDEESAAQINGERPFDGKPEMPAAFRFSAGVEDRTRAADCLAAAAFYEAGADREGQEAVAQVVLNRVRHPAYPKTVCEVVFEGAERKTGCQFTFTCDGALRRRPSEAQWLAARKVAEEALDGGIDKAVGTATHYHAEYVVPYWSPNLQKIARVGPHIFYRWPGGFGSRRVFRDQGKREEPHIAKLAWLANHDSAADAGEPGTREEQSFAEMIAAMPPVVAGKASTGQDADQIVIGLDMKQPSGRWAMAALDRCDGRADCQVIGYPAGRTPEGRPAFLYTRDGNSGLDRALWDCRSIKRPSDDQCLPEDDAALRHMMRDRDRLAAK